MALGIPRLRWLFTRQRNSHNVSQQPSFFFLGGAVEVLAGGAVGSGAGATLGSAGVATDEASVLEACGEPPKNFATCA
jgi:hypothetical protein